MTPVLVIDYTYSVGHDAGLHHAHGAAIWCRHANAVIASQQQWGLQRPQLLERRRNSRVHRRLCDAQYKRAVPARLRWSRCQPAPCNPRHDRRGERLQRDEHRRHPPTCNRQRLAPRARHVHNHTDGVWAVSLLRTQREQHHLSGSELGLRVHRGIRWRSEPIGEGAVRLTLRGVQGGTVGGTAEGSAWMRLGWTPRRLAAYLRIR